MRIFGVLAAVVAACPLLTFAAPTCDAPGYQKTTRPYFSQKSYALSTSKACGDRCWKEARCSSYASGQGACYLYDAKLSQNYLSNSRSSYKFYEKSCASPPPTCKQVGYDDSNARTKFFTQSQCSLSTCSALCRSRDRCQSFRHGQNTCVLYTTPVSSKFRSDRRSPFTFYDRACRLPGTATTTAQATTRSSSTTSVRRGDVLTTSTTRSTSTSTRTTSTSTSSAAALPPVQGTTFSDVTPMFALGGGNRKRQIDGSPNLSTGYFSKDFKSTGERFLTQEPANALKVKFTVPNGSGFSAQRLNLIAENSAAYADLPAIALVKDLTPGKPNQLFLGAAMPGSPPASGDVNSLKRANPAGSYTAQSAIWTVDLTSFAMKAEWINADGSATPLSLLTQNGALFLTDNKSAFPGAQSLTATAGFPDPGAACANSGLEYVPALKACDKKCPSFYPIRDPVSGVCGTGCPSGQIQKFSTTCVCADEATQTMIDNVCRPRKFGTNVTPSTTFTTTSAGATSTTTTTSAAATTTASTTTATATTTSGGSGGTQTFSDIEVSFNLPASKKRQADLDLSYGYISGVIDERTSSGRRFLTSNKADALKISFTLPAGSTRGENVNLVGPSRALASGIPTVAIIGDIQELEGGSGQAFGKYANVLYLGSSDATAVGALPREGVDNTMSRAKRGDASGKGFIAQTAVWDVDTTTGSLTAYWIDKTGIKNKLALVTSGNDLFFTPVAMANQINATPLNIRAELPGTPTPPLVGGPADCREGMAKCAACPDPVNSCRARTGFCVQRDDVGACGYNCSPGGNGQPPSTDCWRCPNGYFGKGLQGCTALPCPDPANQYRDRDGCHQNPVCTAPQEHDGHGNCVRIFRPPPPPSHPTTDPPCDVNDPQSNCPACLDNSENGQCRARNGTCVARDNIGGCGYNCHFGQSECWRCPDGYFAMGNSGCSGSFPCPDPPNQFRNRTGCFTIPTCIPPQEHNGFGECVTFIRESPPVGPSAPGGP